MPPQPFLSKVQRQYLVRSRLEGNCIDAIIANYATQYPTARIPHRSTIWRLVKKFDKEATLLNLHPGRSGRRKSARTPQTIQLIRNVLNGEINQSLSFRHSSSRRNNFNVSQSTFIRIVKHDLKLWAYKHRRIVRLTDRHKHLRLTMCRSLVLKPNIYFRRLLVSDECLFVINGHNFNRSTNRCWAPSRSGVPPGFASEGSQSVQKIMCFAYSVERVIFSHTSTLLAPV